MIFDTLYTLFAFILTLSILVTVHELGHFFVARRSGVKVLRFSVGFGKSLWSWFDRHGTEFCFAVIPLGGYVKMLDEREGKVAEEEKIYSFQAQSALKKMAIVVAGPVANFLLAITILWVLYMVGFRSLVPLVGQVTPESYAEKAGIKSGEVIYSINGKSTPSWHMVELELLAMMGETSLLELEVGLPEIPVESRRKTQVHLDKWLATASEQPLKFFGITPFTPNVPAVIGKLIEDGAANRAGLKADDLIAEINRQPIDSWQEFVTIIRDNPSKNLDILVKRNDVFMKVRLRPDTQTTKDEQVVGYIGAGFKPIDWPEHLITIQRYNPLSAMYQGINFTWNFTCITANAIWKMTQGLISLNNLGGPITIAKVSGASLGAGLDNFFFFLALLSVSLGFINILPIPTLDGGHLLFHFIEWVKGSPISDAVQTFFLRLGISLVLSVMIFSIINDLIRHF